MKRTLFALALLVPVMASAEVNVEVSMSKNGETWDRFAMATEQQPAEVEFPDGSMVEAALVSEEQQLAQLRVTISLYDGQTITFGAGRERFPYGTPQEFPFYQGIKFNITAFREE